MFSKIVVQIKRRKFAVGVTLLFIVGGAYFGYSKIFGDDGAVRYATAQVQKGTLIISVSGSGQVSASNQVDIKPKASGDVVYAAVKNGQGVRAGALIVQLDAGDGRKTVRDAEANLESAKISLEKLRKPADALSLIQTENALAQAAANLQKAYDDGFISVAEAFVDLPGVMADLRSVLYGTSLSRDGGQDNISAYADMVKTYDENVIVFKDKTASAYAAAVNVYDSGLINYRTLTRASNTETVEKLIRETRDIAMTAAEAVKSAGDMLGFVNDRLVKRNIAAPALLAAHQNTLSLDTGKVNSRLAAFINITNAIASAKYSISEKTEAMAKLKAGADALDIQSAELAVRQRENALLDAKERQADYFVRAPFDGVVTGLDAKVGSVVSSATVLATLITRQKIAEISLNEVDVAQVKVGQKTTLTFDAVPDLTITGQVAEVDAVGTVSQGVVTYTVKISFDAEDDRVKTAMSVSAAIVTEAKQDILLAPNSAVKSQGDSQYVEMVEDGDRSVALAANLSGAILKNSPRRQPIEVGLSNDEFTEIVGGLEEGDIVITRTIQPTAAQSTRVQQQSGGLRIPGLPGGGGFRR